MIQVGSKVKCIDISVKPDQVVFRLLHMPNWVELKSYHIRQICMNKGIVDGYLLEEIVNPKCKVELLGGKEIEPRFATWRFAEEQTTVEEEVEYSSSTNEFVTEEQLTV